MLESPSATYGNFWLDLFEKKIVDRDPALVARRMQVDAALFGQWALPIRCALLSHDGQGASFYGRFAVTLDLVTADDRVSLLEDNPFNVEVAHVSNMCRSSWQKRHKLVVVRYGSAVRAAPSAPLSELLRVSGSARLSQSFIEAHIWDTFTVATFKSVLAQMPPGVPDPRLTGDIARIRDLCATRGLPFAEAVDLS
jgi:hypothetical protein